MAEAERFAGLVRLQEVLERLRAPEGCPWDREQTPHSIRHNLLEEVYELLEAVDTDSTAELEEELGDVLVQVLFYCLFYSEEGRLTLDTVAAKAAEKLIRRHPHVFGQVEVDGVGQVLRNWEAIKQREREEADTGKRSVLDGVPAALPSLARAYTVQKKAARVGFDWDSPEGPLDKIAEESREILEQLESGDLDQQSLEEEIGDLFFALVNFARHLHVEPEQALRGAVDKFSRRFKVVEESAKASGRALSTMTLAELDELWEASKRGQNNAS